MSMTKAGKRPLRSLTAHEKLLAVKRVSAGGESKASVARDIGVPESTLRGWCKNQAKIFNQARASPNHLEENEGSPAKRAKVEEPYNLSMKDTSDSSYSPNSQFDSGVEFGKSTTETESETSPINLRVASTQAAVTKTTPISTSSTDKEREKNRAELARLSAELGLNRPEVFLAGFGASNSVNDTILFWNSIYQQLNYQQKILQQQQQQIKYSSTVDAGTKQSTSGPEKRDKILPNIEQQPSVQESVNYWLRQQSLMGLNTSTPTSTTSLSFQQPTTSQSLSPNPAITTTTSAISEKNTSSSAFINSMAANSAVNQISLWNWYKPPPLAGNQLKTLSPPQANSDKPILYNQLVQPELDKEKQNDQQDTENEAKEEKPRINTKNRSVLDNIFINNSLDATETSANNVSDKEESDTSSIDAHQAVRHGEKFLKWLESCSHPSVTAVQIMALQGLIKNLKKGFDRKNGDYQNNKTKMRRK